MSTRSLLPRHHAETTPDKTAYVMADGGTVVTYADLEAQANRVGHLLRSHGVQPGATVAFCLPNDFRYLSLVWGCVYAGVRFTPISSHLKRPELAYILEDCEATLVIASASLAKEVGELPSAVPGVKAWLSTDGSMPGFESYDEVLATMPTEPLDDTDVEGEEMLYSSGTTGRPKGVRRAAAQVRTLGSPDPTFSLARGLFGIGPDAVYLSTAPLYHAAPMRFAMSLHRVGGTVVVMEKFDAERALQLIEQHKVTTSQWVPTMFVRLLKLPEEVRNRYDLTSLTCVVHAAAPCPANIKRRLIDWWGPIVHEYYGGTEGNGITYCNTEEWLAHPGTVGRPILGTVHILDEQGDELPPGEVGTIHFGDGPSFEYHNDSEKTARSRDPKGRGWTTMGDLGYVDEDGYLYLSDRRDDLIIVAGTNVYPQEVEAVLVEHPAVVDVAVIGVPDEEYGETVQAVVQPAAGAVADDDLAAELIAYCKERLASIKCPRGVVFRSQLPRLPTGKLAKHRLRNESVAATAQPGEASAEATP